MLQMLAALPLVGAVVPPEPESEAVVEPVVTPYRDAPPVPERPVMQIDWTVPWQVMAFKLWENYEAYEAVLLAKPGYEPVDEQERLFLHGATYRMCKHLLTKSEDSIFDGHDMAAAYDPLYPNHDRTVMDKVKYKVIDYKTGGLWFPYEAPKQFGGTETRWMLDNTGLSKLPKPQFRKSRARINLQQFKEMSEDMRAFHGIDFEVEFVSILGQQLALEIQMEIRHAHRQSEPIETYAICIPPMLGPCLLPPEDFSVDRRIRFSYSKGGPGVV